MVFDFSAFRDSNVNKNTQMLLDEDIPNLPKLVRAVSSAPSTPKKPRTPKIKSRVGSTSTTPIAATPDARAEERDRAGLRSSGRVRSQTLSAQEKEVERAKLLELRDEDDDEAEEEGSYYENGKRVKTEKGYAPEKLGKRQYSPKRFGSIPGVRVGTTFNFRMEASQASIHAPVVAGISGHPDLGCWSIAVSGGYVDDVDLGYRLTFSGSGGRDFKGTVKNPKNLRTAPQTADQTWDGLNAALKRSVTTKKPIRVLRGFKGKSPFAPLEGYRYDGLYVATKAWQDVGESGFKVCRIALVRLPGQPKLPIQPGRESEVQGLEGMEKAADTLEEPEAVAPVADESQLSTDTPVEDDASNYQDSSSDSAENSKSDIISSTKKRDAKAIDETDEGEKVVDETDRTKRRRSTRGGDS